MVTLKALPSTGMVEISRNDTNAIQQVVYLSNAEVYFLAFLALEVLGMVRDAGPNSNTPIVREVPTPTREEELRLMDPTHEVVPSLQTMLAHLHHLR